MGPIQMGLPFDELVTTVIGFGPTEVWSRLISFRRRTQTHFYPFFVPLLQDKLSLTSICQRFKLQSRGMRGDREVRHNLPFGTRV